MFGRVQQQAHDERWSSVRVCTASSSSSTAILVLHCKTRKRRKKDEINVCMFNMEYTASSILRIMLLPTSYGIYGRIICYRTSYFLYPWWLMTFCRSKRVPANNITIKSALAATFEILTHPFLPGASSGSLTLRGCWSPSHSSLPSPLGRARGA